MGVAFDFCVINSAVILFRSVIRKQNINAIVGIVLEATRSNPISDIGTYGIGFLTNSIENIKKFTQI